MMIKFDSPDPSQPSGPRQLQIRLPYAPPAGVGLGDVIARITRSVGATPCQPCKQRQEELNRRLRVMPW